MLLKPQMFSKEVLVADAEFRCPDQAICEIGRTTNSRLSLELDEAGKFGMDMKFLAHGSLIAIQSSVALAGKVMFHERVRSLGIYTVGAGRGGILRGSENLTTDAKGTLIFDSGRSDGYLCTTGAKTEVLLINFTRVMEAAQLFIGRPIDDDWDWAQLIQANSAFGRGIGGLIQATASNIELASRNRVSSCHPLRLCEEALIMFILENAAIFRRNPHFDRMNLPSNRQVRHAFELIREHHSDITVAEVAFHLGVSVRALQVAFRKSLGVSPHRVIKQARLARARQFIETGTVRTVQQVADHLGFSNAARFACEYREEFGESPLDALKRVLTERQTPNI